MLVHLSFRITEITVWMAVTEETLMSKTFSLVYLMIITDTVKDKTRKLYSGNERMNSDTVQILSKHCCSALIWIIVTIVNCSRVAFWVIHSIFHLYQKLFCWQDRAEHWWFLWTSHALLLNSNQGPTFCLAKSKTTKQLSESDKQSRLQSNLMSCITKK